MTRKDKYGRGSAAANGEGFVDLAPGDTFAALEAQLKRRIADRFDNAVLGMSASIGSKRNASELAKHLASGEEEEAHKFAAKNIGVLFVRGQLGISHDDKKAVDETREKPKIFRVFTPFVFAGESLVAMITIKPADDGLRLYAIEALDIMRGERLEVHLAAEPRQFKTSRLLLADRISYYVGDVNRTHPKFVGRDEMFSTERTVGLLEGIMQDFYAKHQAPSTKRQAPQFSIIIPVYNVAPYLRECLDSVLAQTFTDWEAICVDDGSTDGSGEILDEYREKVERARVGVGVGVGVGAGAGAGAGGQRTGNVVVIHQKNAGVSAARNAALDVARGEWMAFLDADDVVDSQWLSHADGLIQSYSPDLVHLDMVTWQEGESCPLGRETGGKEEVEYFTGRDAGLWGARTFLKKGYSWLNAVRRECVRDARFPVGMKIQEDNIFMLKIAANLRSVVVSDFVGYYYRKGRGGASTHWRESAIVPCRLRVVEELIKTYSVVKESYVDAGLSRDVRWLYGDCILSHLWLAVSELRRSGDKNLKQHDLQNAARCVKESALVDFSRVSWSWRMPWRFFISYGVGVFLTMRLKLDDLRSRMVSGKGEE